MNGTQLIDAVYVRTGTPTADQQITRTVVLGFLNEALRTYRATSYEWPWLEETVSTTLAANTSLYDLWSGEEPRGVRRVTISYSTGEAIDLEPASDREIAQWADATGAPRYYVVEWNTDDASIRVMPAPDAAGGTLSVEYVGTEPDILDSSGSAPRLPSELRDLLVDHASNRVMLATANLQRAGTYFPIDSPLSQSKLRRSAARRRGAPTVRMTLWG